MFFSSSTVKRNLLCIHGQYAAISVKGTVQLFKNFQLQFASLFPVFVSFNFLIWVLLLLWYWQEKKPYPMQGIVTSPLFYKCCFHFYLFFYFCILILQGFIFNITVPYKVKLWVGATHKNAIFIWKLASGNEHVVFFMLFWFHVQM